MDLPPAKKARTTESMFVVAHSNQPSSPFAILPSSLEEILTPRSWQARLGLFRSLTPEKRLTIFLPGEVSISVLPKQEKPQQWAKMEQYALEKGCNEIRGRYEVATDSDMSAGPYASEDSDEERVFDVSDYLLFMRRLPYCPPLTLGFHAPTLTNNEWCFCPLGKHMGPWREFVGMQRYTDDQHWECTFKGKKSPFSLLKHLESKKASCPGHDLVYVYLQYAFQHYYSDGIRHIGFEDYNTREYKKAEAIIARQQEARQQQQMKILLKANRSLHDKLNLQKQLIKEFNAKAEEELAPEKILFAKEKSSRFFHGIRHRLQCATSRIKNTKIDLVVNANFNISDLMNSWYDDYQQNGLESNYNFLFAPLPESCSSAALLKRKIISRWIIHYCSRHTVFNKFNIDTEAEDEGGPSRDFFSRVWTQLETLKLYLPEQKKLSLFFSSAGGLQLTTDEIIEGTLFYLEEEEQKQSRRKIERFYIAIGRMIAHCLLLEKKYYGPIPVSRHIFPKLYQAILFRGLDVLNDAYYLATLIEDTLELSVEDFSKQDASRRLRKQLGIESNNRNDIELRKKIQNVFVDTRAIALKMLQEGLNLEGEIEYDICFGLMPNAVVTKLLFSDQKITREMLLDNKGCLRFIQFQNYEGDQCEGSEEETHQMFERELAKFFESKLTSDPKFILRFAELCTGSAFIGDVDNNPDYKITVEFNRTEVSTGSLPVVHTCVSTIKIPWDAYDANMEMFEVKLEQTMQYSENVNFDMA